jgi:hypothetical protein
MVKSLNPFFRHIFFLIYASALVYILILIKYLAYNSPWINGYMVKIVDLGIYLLNPFNTNGCLNPLSWMHPDLSGFNLDGWWI